MIETLLERASSVMTVISFITFVGILWWTFIYHKEVDFNLAASMPFDDKDNDNEKMEGPHG